MANQAKSPDRAITVAHQRYAHRMHYPGDVDADQPHAGYRMPDEDDVLWPDSGYGDPDGGTDGGFALASSHYGAAGSFARKGPARGFPPAPGQPPPVYPPGQFAAWNLPADGAGSVAAAWPGAASAEHGYGWPAAKGPGGAAYPPSVDVPSIQPWPADDDATGSASSWPGLASPVAAPTGTSTTGASTAGASTTGSGTGQAAPAARTPIGKEAAGAKSAGGPPRGAPRGKRARKGGGKARLLLAVGAVLVIAAAAVTYVLKFSHHGTPTAGSSPSASPSAPATASPSPSPSSSGRWGHIQTRKVDPVPLTLAEVFPAHFTAAGQTYTLTAAKRGKQCEPAVIGAKLQAAVRAAACTQVLRGSYLSGDKKIMGTIGVLNLQSARLAQHTGLATGTHEFILQLRGTKGPTRNLGKGTGIEIAVVKGHYLILIWDELASQHKPKNAAQRADLIEFCNRVLNGSANVGLSKRLVNGTSS
jgi:hypothetical protein